MFMLIMVLNLLGASWLIPIGGMLRAGLDNPCGGILDHLFKMFLCVISCLPLHWLAAGFGKQINLKQGI